MFIIFYYHFYNGISKEDDLTYVITILLKMLLFFQSIRKFHREKHTLLVLNVN